LGGFTHSPEQTARGCALPLHPYLSFTDSWLLDPEYPT
jgi:hypothetical protein